jgi:hypothetical protein
MPRRSGSGGWRWLVVAPLLFAALSFGSQGCGVSATVGGDGPSLAPGTTTSPTSTTAPQSTLPTAATSADELENVELFPIEVGNRWGYIDRGGTAVIEPRFAYVEEFAEGLASVDADGDGYDDGYIDALGEIVLKPAYNYLGSFSEGLAMVDQDGPGGLQGYIDKTGATVIRPAYMYARYFRGGLAAVKKVDTGWGYIDKNGQYVIEPKYRSAGDFSEGLAWVETLQGYGFIDRSGRLVIPDKFSDATSFSQGLAAVGISKTSEETGTPEWNLNGGSWGFIDAAGRLVIPGEFAMAHGFSDGLAAVVTEAEWAKAVSEAGNIAKARPKWGYIDSSGELIIEPQFLAAGDFRGGLASVKFSDGKKAYIDTAGAIVWTQP